MAALLLLLMAAVTRKRRSRKVHDGVTVNARYVQESVAYVDSSTVTDPTHPEIYVSSPSATELSESFAHTTSFWGSTVTQPWYNLQSMVQSEIISATQSRSSRLLYLMRTHKVIRFVGEKLFFERLQTMPVSLVAEAAPIGTHYHIGPKNLGSEVAVLLLINRCGKALVGGAGQVLYQMIRDPGTMSLDGSRPDLAYNWALRNGQVKRLFPGQSVGVYDGCRLEAFGGFATRGTRVVPGQPRVQWVSGGDGPAKLRHPWISIQDLMGCPKTPANQDWSQVLVGTTEWVAVFPTVAAEDIFRATVSAVSRVAVGQIRLRRQSIFEFGVPFPVIRRAVIFNPAFAIPGNHGSYRDRTAIQPEGTFAWWTSEDMSCFPTTLPRDDGAPAELEPPEP